VVLTLQRVFTFSHKVIYVKDTARMLMTQVIPGDARDAMWPNTLNRSPISESKERPGGFRYPNYTSLPCQSPHSWFFLWECAYSRMPLSLEYRLIKLCNCSHPQNKRSWGKYFGVKLVFFFPLIFQSHTCVCVFYLPSWKYNMSSLKVNLQSVVSSRWCSKSHWDRFHQDGA